MTITLTNPDGLPVVDVYHQVAVAAGARLVFLAGQVSVDASGALVGAGDLPAQVEQAYRNVATALGAAGATFAHVAKLTIYVVGLDPERMGLALEGIARGEKALGGTPRPPLTGIGVQALADPGYLVEIEATAVLD